MWTNQRVRQRTGLTCFESSHSAGTKGRPKQHEKEKSEVTRELRDDESRNRDTPNNNKPPRKRLRVNRNKRLYTAYYIQCTY